MARRSDPDPAAVEQLIVEQARLLARQLQEAADAAPDGQVLARVEALAVAGGRDLARRAVQATLQAQAAAAEKKGRRAGPAGAAGSSPTGGGPAASS
jgi:hypothetical protein